MRDGDTPASMRFLKRDTEGGTLYVPENNHNSRNTNSPPFCHGGSNPALLTNNKIDLKATLAKLQGNLTNDRLTALAEATGVPIEGWTKLNPGWCDASDLRMLRASGESWADNYPSHAWCFPEHDGHGQLAGLSLRAPDGRKGASSGLIGAKRGLIVPADLHAHPGPVLIVEGASDVAVCCSLGLAAVGRPSNQAGAADLANLLHGRDVLVVGEHDGKPGGAWPGRDGAKGIATKLAMHWDEPVKWTLPPADAKDLRVWLTANPTGGRDELLASLKDSAILTKPQKKSMSDALVDLALESYRLGVTESGEAFAVQRDGPAVAIMLRGSKSALRAKLAKVYRQVTGKTPNASALTDALLALEGQAMDATPELMSLRLAEHGNGVVLDLGDPSGQVVVIEPNDWKVVDDSPVLFRRTALTGPLPKPVGEGHPEALNGLRELLNVTDDTWPLVIGWLVSACIPSIPHPILMLGGEQGTGKSTAARLMVGLVDQSPALLRSEPRDTEQWAMVAAGSWCVAIDNVSRIPNWWSDALCKAVTGDGWVRRKLYTDSDLAVLAFKRCVVLTSIDAGAFRGDLGDRLLLVDLEQINETDRKTETEIEHCYAKMQPSLMAGLFSAVSRTLAARPDVTLDKMPRMADFARVLAALDLTCPELTGGRALAIYLSQRGRIANDVIESDPIASAIVALVDENDGSWTGTAGDLYKTITPERPQRGWPKTARGLVSSLKRATTALRQVGVSITKPPRTNRGQIYIIERMGNQPSLQSLPSPINPGGSPAANSSDGPAMDSCSTVTPTHTHESPPPDPPEAINDGRDGRDCWLQPSSDATRPEDDAAQIAMQDAYDERMAACTIDGGLSEQDAEAVALEEMNQNLAL